MARMIPICKLDDIPKLGARRVKRKDGLEIAVFRTSDDQVFAIEDRCPHKGGPLSQGIVYGTKVACPLHNWSINLDSGSAVAPDEGCVKRFACEREGDQVLLDPDEPLAALASDAPATLAQA